MLPLQVFSQRKLNHLQPIENKNLYLMHLRIISIITWVVWLLKHFFLFFWRSAIGSCSSRDNRKAVIHEHKRSVLHIVPRLHLREAFYGQNVSWLMAVLSHESYGSLSRAMAWHHSAQEETSSSGYVMRSARIYSSWLLFCFILLLSWIEKLKVNILHSTLIVLRWRSAVYFHELN